MDWEAPANWNNEKATVGKYQNAIGVKDPSFNEKNWEPESEDAKIEMTDTDNSSTHLTAASKENLYAQLPRERNDLDFYDAHKERLTQKKIDSKKKFGQARNAIENCLQCRVTYKIMCCAENPAKYAGK